MSRRSGLRLATRGSPLARWQAERVAALLRDQGVGTSLVFVETEGDRRVDAPLHAIGGQGVFAKEVQAAVLWDRADVAVHSAKDLPVEGGPEGLVLAAVVERADPRDVLVVAGGSDGSEEPARGLDRLPTGALVATGSARRRAQLANLRPDLLFAELRGNMARRLGTAGTGDVAAVVVAKAAIDRLGWEPPDGVAVEVLEPTTMVPQVGQGAVAVECREGDVSTRITLARIEDVSARRAVTAERAFLAELGGGCTLPVGAHAVSGGDGPDSLLRLSGMLASEDGRVVLRHRATGAAPEELGRAVARALLGKAGGPVLPGGDR